MPDHLSKQEETEPRRISSFPCSFCGRRYYLPKPRSCCEKGLEWDNGIEEVRVAIGKAVKEAMKS